MLTAIALLATGLAVSIWTALAVEAGAAPTSVFARTTRPPARYQLLGLIGLFASVAGSGAAFRHASFWRADLVGALRWIVAQ